jgi:3'-5' exoribonuclease
MDLESYRKKQDEQTMIDVDTGLIKKNQYIENLREGDIVNDIFAVKIKNPPRNYKKGTMFGIAVTDKTGEINVKFWGGDNKERVKRLYDSFKNGDVVQIREGNVELYMDNLQISINEMTGGIRRCNPKEYKKSDFIPALSETRIQELFIEIQKNIENIKNKQIKNLLKSFFNNPDFVNQYKYSPSAITHHHNYVGGNLEHAVGVIRLCLTICEMYPEINKDLVVAGAILHDVGKLKEYKTSASIDKTNEGNFIGHIVIGDRWIRKIINDLRKNGQDFNSNLENYLCHMILSHHGKYEFGSPRMPKLIEACVLFQADLMDSQVKHYIQKINDSRNSTDDKWAFLWDSDLGYKRNMYLGDIKS